MRIINKDFRINPISVVRTSGVSTHLLRLSVCGSDITDYEKVLKQNYSEIRQLLNHENICRSLLFASHDLLNALDRIQQKPPHAQEKHTRQGLLSLYQYAARGAFKTSPFSRLTGCSIRNYELGIRNSITNYELGITNHDADQFWRATASITPNLSILEALYAVLLQIPDFYEQLSLKTNPTVINKGDQKTGAEIQFLAFDGEHELLQTLTANALILAILETKTNTFRAFVNQITDLTDASKTAAEHYLLSLIDTGLFEWILPENGLSIKWAEKMYRFLGTLPASETIVEAANLVNCLRTAARTLPFADISAAREMQNFALELCQSFFAKQDLPAPVSRAEEVFYEDWTGENDGLEAAPNFEPLIKIIEKQRDKFFKNNENNKHDKFLEKFKGYFREIQTPDFQDFEQEIAIGLVFQMGQTETGETKYILNEMYPSGGKLFARWMHLFPEKTVQVFRENCPKNLVNFSRQSFFNGNIQPALLPRELVFASSKNLLNTEAQIPISEMKIGRVSEQQLRLFYKNEPLLLADNNLESIENLPPVMRFLWEIGVPKISKTNFFGTQKASKSAEENSEQIRFFPRVEVEKWVIYRSKWEVNFSVFESILNEKVPQKQKNEYFFNKFREFAQANNLPELLFFHCHAKREKPQYLHLNCPLSVLHFQKTVAQKKAAVTLTEMLPLPPENGFVREFVFEMISCF